MNALLRKEFRENVRLAVLGLVIHTLMLGQLYRQYVSSPINMAQPLADTGLLWNTSWFCAIFGAVLGWLQVHNERRPDLWAFLLHRPMTRTGIFLGKVMAGLGLYGLAVGLPLLGFILWARLPGHVAAPFELAMLQPVTAYVLAGMLYYFAGMLAGLRQARWYASRVLGAGVALLISPLLSISPEFWQSLATLSIGAGILVTAVWGGFQSDGHYDGQPTLGKAALTAALTLGGLIVAVVAAALLSNFFLGSQPSATATFYCMTTNGAVYKVTQDAGVPEKIVDLEGRPLQDEMSGSLLKMTAFNRRLAAATTIDLEQPGPLPHHSWMGKDLALARAWRNGPPTLWYYWIRYGRLVGFDVKTRRCIGSLGPNGFAPDLTGGGDRFSETEGPTGSRTLRTATTVFRVEPDQRSGRPLFTTTDDDPILAKDEVVREDYGWQYTIVVTKRFVHLLTVEGQPVWKTPYQSAYPDSTRFQFYFLEPPGQFALWISPGGQVVDGTKPTIASRVIWLTRDQGVLRSIDLPALPARRYAPRPEEKLIAIVLPPTLFAALPILNVRPWPMGTPGELRLLSWASAVLVCLPIVWCLGRRYRFSFAEQAGWAGFHILFGLPGLLAFLSVQEWPAREACPNCKKLRLVDRARCEHCGAAFAPPEKTGTEVFAPLETA